MNAIAEIDKAGRIVVPKRMRDALHLVGGTRLILRQEGESIVVQAETMPCGLHLKNGTLVYDAGPLPPINVTDWIDQSREERLHSLLSDA